MEHSDETLLQIANRMDNGSGWREVEARQEWITLTPAEKCEVLSDVVANQARRIAIIDAHRLALEERLAACEKFEGWLDGAFDKASAEQVELENRVSAIERRFQGLKNFLEGMRVL